MVEQPAPELGLTAEQRRNPGCVYRMLLGWRRDRKHKVVCQPASDSLPEEQQSQQPKSNFAEQTESES